jgi:hypothetical protein
VFGFVLGERLEREQEKGGRGRGCVLLPSDERGAETEERAGRRRWGLGEKEKRGGIFVSVV